MRRLGLDTSTRATSVALCDETGAIELRDDPAPDERPGHARRLLPLAAEVLERAGCDWSEIESIVVGRGPGSFTGLRIGIATARGLASALELPLIGVSSLESLAVPAAAAGASSAVTVLDARRGEAFAAAWEIDVAEPQRAVPPQAVAPERLADFVAGLQSPLAVGDGAVKWRSILERAGATVPPDESELHRVSAAAHCRLARNAPAGRPEDVLPEYLRLPDAEIARRAANTDGD